MTHPPRQGFAIAMPSTGDGSRPGRNRAQQQGGGSGEGKDDSGLSRLADRVVRPADDIIDASLGIRGAQTGESSGLLDEVGAIIRCDAAMTCRGQQDSTGLRSFGRKIDIGGAPWCSKQAIELVAQHRFCSRCAGHRGRLRFRSIAGEAGDGRGQTKANHHRERPDEQAVNAIAAFDGFGRTGQAVPGSAGDVSAEAESHKGLQQKIKAGEQREG